MEWMRTIDGYCERMDPGYWAEPLNAVTNAAFLIAAAIMWVRVRHSGLGLAHTLVILLAGIGVGSYLFHTHAQVWAAFADSGFIAMFCVVYVFAINRDYLGLRGWRAYGATGLFIPYVVATVPIFAMLPFFQISSGYWPLPLLLGLYGLALRQRAPATAQGLWAATGLVCVSLIFRSLDETLCAVNPLGTHFVWHILNGVLLGWLIEVYLRHMRGPLAAPLRGR